MGEANYMVDFEGFFGGGCAILVLHRSRVGVDLRGTGAFPSSVERPKL